MNSIIALFLAGTLLNPTVAQAPEEVAKVPILMYHHVGEQSNSVVIKEETLREHLEAIDEAGYNTIDFEDLYSFVHEDGKLPENPIIITFDDGYESNYEIAYPILVENEMKASFFAIGTSVGKDTYKATNIGIVPHFSYEQALEMQNSGYIDIYSHTFDMHMVKTLDAENFRDGVLQKSGETDEEYKAALEEDFSKSKLLIEDNLGVDCNVLSYPFGKYSDKANEVAKELGFDITLSTKPVINYIKKDVPETLELLGRQNVDGSLTAEQVLLLIDNMG